MATYIARFQTYADETLHCDFATELYDGTLRREFATRVFDATLQSLATGFPLLLENVWESLVSVVSRRCHIIVAVCEVCIFNFDRKFCMVVCLYLSNIVHLMIYSQNAELSVI